MKYKQKIYCKTIPYTINYKLQKISNSHKGILLILILEKKY